MCKPIFLCKLYFTTEIIEIIDNQRHNIEYHLENKTNGEYNIVVMAIQVNDDKLKEPEFQLFNVQNLKEIDFEEFKKEINLLLLNNTDI